MVQSNWFNYGTYKIVHLKMGSQLSLKKASFAWSINATKKLHKTRKLTVVILNSQRYGPSPARNVLACFFKETIADATNDEVFPAHFPNKKLLFVLSDRPLKCLAAIIAACSPSEFFSIGSISP